MTPSRENRERSSDDPGVVVDSRGSGEWIVSGPVAGRKLHVYRVSPDDWLATEVGRDNEGRGADLEQAITALSRGASPPDWWSAVPGVISSAEG